MRKRMVTVATCFAICFTMSMQLTAYCSGNTSETEKAGIETSDDLKTINLALPTWVGYMPLFVAKDKGYFEENGLDVKLNIIEGLAERKQALISGDLDGLATSVDVIVNLDGSGVPMDMVWVLDRSNGSDGIVCTSDIKDPSELKERNVATEIGSTEHFFLLKVLEQYGMDQNDINLVPMNIGDAGSAFVAGRVDAAVTYDPYLAQGIAAGGNSFTTAEYDIDLMDTVGFSTSFVEKHPDEVKGFVMALSEAAEYFEQDANKEECYSIAAKGLKMDEADVEDTSNKLEVYDLSGNENQMGRDSDGKLYSTTDEIAEFYQDQGLNDILVKASDVIDPDFVRELSQ